MGLAKAHQSVNLRYFLCERIFSNSSKSIKSFGLPSFAFSAIK
jgi:hypothetical protein